MAGLGGSFLSLGSTGLFFPDIISGRGWIALAIVIFGKLAGELGVGGIPVVRVPGGNAIVPAGQRCRTALPAAAGVPFVLTIVALGVQPQPFRGAAVVDHPLPPRRAIAPLYNLHQ